MRVELVCLFHFFVGVIVHILISEEKIMCDLFLSIHAFLNMKLMRCHDLENCWIQIHLLNDPNLDILGGASTVKWITPDPCLVFINNDSKLYGNF